jgi:hypothetical protein
MRPVKSEELKEFLDELDTGDQLACDIVDGFYDVDCNTEDELLHLGIDLGIKHVRLKRGDRNMQCFYCYLGEEFYWVFGATEEDAIERVKSKLVRKQRQNA